jgi:DNA adenine methylase
VTTAREVLAQCGRDELEKTIWSSPAGKKRLASRLASMLPAHKTYVEPFAGSAAVLFAKEPAAVEAIGDADPEIAPASRTIKRLTSAQLARLRQMSWTGDEATFKRIFDASPSDEVAKLHRFLYLSNFSYGGLRRRSFNAGSAGATARTAKRVEAFAPRLKNVHIHSGDYEALIRKYDTKDTVFFLDPPYAGYNVDVGEGRFDEEHFCELLKSLKGKFLLTYGVRGKLPGLLKAAGFAIKRIRSRRSISSMRGVGGASVLTQLLVANYDLVSKGLELEPWNGDSQTGDADILGDDEGKAPVCGDNDVAPFAKTVPLIKDVDPADERFVLGIVLEPEVVDAQGDIYSSAEVRQAAHRFMEEFGGLGLMHGMRVNGQVKVLESYVSPMDFAVGEVAVRKGTWLLAVRILSEALWDQVKKGELTGFSIGGSARRQAEIQQPAEFSSEVA